MRPSHLPQARNDTAKALRGHAAVLRERAADPGATAYYRAASGGMDPADLIDGTETMARLLSAASLWWVSRDMTVAALAASDSLPEWSPSEAVPDDIGLLVWDGGMPPMPWTTSPESAMTITPLGGLTPLMVPVDGILWHRIGTVVRVMLLTQSAPIKEHMYGAYADMPLFCFGELTESLDQTIMGITARSGRQRGALAAIGATWLMMQQERVHDRKTLAVGPKTAKASRQPGRVSKVTVIDLRRSKTPPSEPDESTGGRHLINRHLVRGHWRQQACGPERSLRRPTWIPAHVKGPDGAPLVASEKVMAWRY